MTDPYLPLDAAAKALGLTRATLRQQIAAGRLAAIKVSPRLWVVAPAELERYRLATRRPTTKARCEASDPRTCRRRAALEVRFNGGETWLAVCRRCADTDFNLLERRPLP